MKRKQAKPVKNKIGEVKKVLTEGLHVLRDVFNVFFASSQEEYETLKQQAGPNDRVWLEEKQYHKPESIAASELNDVTVRGVGNYHSSEAANDEINAQSLEARELRMLQHKAFLKMKLEEMKAQERSDLQVRNDCLLWQRMNS